MPVLRRENFRGMARRERSLNVKTSFVRPRSTRFGCTVSIAASSIRVYATIRRIGDCEHAAASGNRIILMPESWGPFKNPVVRDYIARLVRISDPVFVRERESLAHLGELPGVDPARIPLQFRSDPLDTGRTLLTQIGRLNGTQPLLGIASNMRIVERTPGERSPNAYLRGLSASAVGSSTTPRPAWC